MEWTEKRRKKRPKHKKNVLLGSPKISYKISSTLMLVDDVDDRVNSCLDDINSYRTEALEDILDSRGLVWRPETRVVPRMVLLAVLVSSLMHSLMKKLNRRKENVG